MTDAAEQQSEALWRRDGRLLFITRLARMFAYGLLSVVLVLYLAAVGLGQAQIGLLLSLTLLGDAAVSLWITTHADRLGRRRMLIAGAGLMLLAGILFAVTRRFGWLLFAATVGVISPSGNEVGPFLAIEQAALTQVVAAQRRTSLFAWYNLAGSFATALGALCGGGLAQVLLGRGLSALQSYRAVVIGYAVIGGLLAWLFTRLSPAVETVPGTAAGAAGLLGLHNSRGVVLRLAALFGLDAFGGGFVVQSIVAYWFNQRFGVEPGVLGAIFFGANVLAGLSALSAARLARRIGLIRTMVFTHIPSSLLLMLVPLMPTLPLAIAVLLVRFSISQMDVPTRQSYTLAVVQPDERSAAAGVTGIARTVGASLAPLITGPLLANPALVAWPFLLAGGIKIGYDLLLYRSFRRLPPPEERKPGLRE
ncbi:MAG: Major Facilitator Superfamily protein [Chloroflexi bacterium ADurb.Bin180]|nr:MAG: Major Facilitator Superfamily protein [Chloroflexi bacterium ADurb.Bin180]